MGTVGGRCAHWGVLAGIAVIAALAAAGCTGSSATPQTIYITPSPGPVTPLPSGVTPAPTVVLPVPAIDSVVISSNAPDNRWQVTFKKAVVSGISDAAATKMNGAIADIRAGKMVILVDQGSASASEIFADALRYYGVAKLVGTHTIGKGVVQELFPITDTTSLKVTVARSPPLVTGSESLNAVRKGLSKASSTFQAARFSATERVR